MKVDANGVKLAFYGIGAVVLFALGYSVYKKLDDISKGITGASDKTRAIGQRIISGVSDTLAEAGHSLDSVVSAVRSTLGLPANDYQMPSQYGAYVIPQSSWPQSAKNIIDFTNKQRGETGYSGWTVYSDGTIISPYKEYLTDNINANSGADMNASVIGRATSSGFLASNVNTDNYDMFASNWNSVGSNVDKIPF